jgi:hypothetical protein
VFVLDATGLIAMRGREQWGGVPQQVEAYAGVAFRRKALEGAPEMTGFQSPVARLSRQSSIS